MKSLYCEPGLKGKILAENTVVCMGSLLPLNDHISSHFGTICLKLSTRAYFMMLFPSMRSKYEILKIDFYDVITSVLYLRGK